MKTLLILRHAKSSWSNARLSDHERPLKKRGRRDAPRIGRLLKSEGLVPDLIVSSSAERAIQTAQLVADNSGYENSIETSRFLYLAGPDIYLDFLTAIDPRFEIAMFVGHNPGVEELVEELTGNYIRMPTAALAQIELKEEDWQKAALDGTSNLINTWWPRQLEQ